MDVKDKLGATPIFYAAVNPENEALEYLVEEYKQYLRVYDKKGNTPLIMAIIAKRAENIHYILQLVPSAIKEKSIIRMTPLNISCRNGFVHTARTLMSYKGSAPNQAGGWDKLTPLWFAAAYGHLELLEFILIFTKAKIDKGDKFGRTPLMMAWRNGESRAAEFLLKYKADVNQQDTSGNTALHYACAYNHPYLAYLLLSLSADPNSQNLWKSTPLSIALLKRNLSCVSIILSNSSHINTDIKDDNGNTLLTIAIESMTDIKDNKSTNLDLVEKILESADPNIPDAEGNTPLMKVVQRITAKQGKGEIDLELRIAKRLLKIGANSAHKNKAGQNALTLIMQNAGYSNKMADNKGICELVELLWANFSFLKDPNAFFSFTKSIISPDTQSMILTFVEKSIKESKEENKDEKMLNEECDEEMPDEDLEEETIKTENVKLPYKIINILDDDGFTPFLRYIEEFTIQGRAVYEKIEKHVTSKNILSEDQLKDIDIDKLLDTKNDNPFGVQNNGGLFGSLANFGQNIFGAFGQNNNQNKYKEIALKIFDEKIAEPFAIFLENLIKFGADQHITVEKIKYYRNADDNEVIRKKDNLGNVTNQYGDKGLSNALHLILEFPSQHVFDSILDSGVSTEEINIKKMTPFFMLVKTKDTNLPEYKYWLDKFISTKADIDSPDQFGISAFWHCYQNQKVDLALYLASKGADINRLDNYGFFALKSELFNNNLARIQQLLNLGADVNKKDEFQRTVLHHAFNRYRVGNDLAIIKYLIGQGADINSKDFKSRVPLHYLFVKTNKRFSNDQNDPVDLIVEVVNLCKNIELTQKDNNGNTVLHYIAQRKALESLRLLKDIINNQDLEIANNDGNTPLAVAMMNQHEDVVGFMLKRFKLNLDGHWYKRKQKNANVNNAQGEESDFEYMMTVDVEQEKEQNDQPKRRKSYFEFCVKKPQLSSIAKLLLEEGYSISWAFGDSFKAGNYQQLFQLLNTMDANLVKEAVKIKDSLGRGIFHSLSKAPDESPFSEICRVLMNDYNLDPNEKDLEGNTPIMLAAEQGKLNLLRALELINCNVKDTNSKNENCIHLMIKGNRIKKYSRPLMLYLINSGVNFNSLYEEPKYEIKNSEEQSELQEKIVYKCTPLIHLIRTELIEVWDKGELIEDIFKQTAMRIDVNQPDSDGKDVFMHWAILNEFQLCKYLIGWVSKNFSNTKPIEEEQEIKILDAEMVQNDAVNELQNIKGQTMEAHKVHSSSSSSSSEEEEMIVTTKYELKRLEKLEQIKQVLDSEIENPELEPVFIKESASLKFKFGIDLSRIDKLGKSVIHYIVTPIDYGSYENDKFLEYMLKFGFSPSLFDNSNKQAFHYTLTQSTGLLLRVFQDLGYVSSDLEVNPNILTYKPQSEWENINYQKDAQDYLDLIKTNIHKETLVPWDPNGQFNSDCTVYCDPDNGIYDCHLTRVDIGREEKDDYLFYKLQIVYDKGRDLWMLFTRWGRIGEVGAFQKTPYSKEEWIKEFEDIFRSKTKNEWSSRKEFKKQWFKYQLVNVNYSNVEIEDYLVPFDFGNWKKSELHPTVQEALKEMTQVAMYVKGLRDSGINVKQMPFSNINRDDLLKARKSLTKLREVLEELEPLELRLNRFNQENKDKIISLREKWYYHSSRFYELIPHEEFKNEIVPPIKSLAMLKQKAEMIDNLVNFEMASKILLGAHKNSKDINPLDYCMKAMGVNIEVLDKSSTEFTTLKEYCVLTWPENKNAYRKIRNIFKIERKGEGEAYEAFKNLGNKFLLFHGTRISNFMGIMSQGLRVAPPEAPKTGYMFGKGVYFADMLQKSFSYWNDFNAPNECSKFMLLCETALGKSYKLTNAQYMDEPPAGCDSTQGLGQHGPCYSKCFAFPEGYRIPQGKYLEYEYEGEAQRNVYLRHNEFIVYKKTGQADIKIDKSNSNPGQIKMRYLIQIK